MQCKICQVVVPQRISAGHSNRPGTGGAFAACKNCSEGISDIDDDEEEAASCLPHRGLRTQTLLMYPELDGNILYVGSCLDPFPVAGNGLSTPF